MTRSEINQVVLAAFNQVIIDNDKNLDGQVNEKTAVMGSDSVLDSIDLVSFIVAVEQALEDDHDVSITLADDRAMSQDVSPFKNIGVLINYVELLISEI